MSKIPENPGKNSAERCLISKMTLKVCRKTHEDLCLEVTRKNGLLIILGENL